MFETTNHIGLDEGAAVGFALAVRSRINNQQIAHQNDLAAIEQSHDAELERYQAVINQLQQQLIRTQVELVSERCEIAGLRAFIKEVKRQDPTTPALASSGETFQNGRPKSIATLVYQREYDKEAVNQGFPGLQGGYAT